jgi:hypothetical protein
MRSKQCPTDSDRICVLYRLVEGSRFKMRQRSTCQWGQCDEFLFRDSESSEFVHETRFLRQFVCAVMQPAWRLEPGSIPFLASTHWSRMHPGLLLLISSTAAAVSSPAIVLGVDWASLLGRSNLVYSWTANETGPEQWTQSLFGGNGGELAGFSVRRGRAGAQLPATLALRPWVHALPTCWVHGEFT